MLTALLATLGLWLGAAHAQDAEADDRAEAALIQTRLWLDMGELSKAVAMSRAGVTHRLDDPRWHRVRLDALFAAGMDPWIEAEYGDPSSLPAEVVVAYADWAAATGPVGLPDVPLEVKGASLVQGRAALRAGDWATARRAAYADESVDHLALRVELAAALADERGLIDALTLWPEEDDVALAPLAPALSGKLKGERKALAKALWARVDAALAEATSPLPILRAAELALAMGDARRLVAAEQRLIALGEGPGDKQALMDALGQGPGALRTWEVPPRPRWTVAQLDAAAKAQMKDERPVVPWGRPDEQARMAEVLAEALREADRPLDADQVLARHLGTCAPSVLPEVLVAIGTTEGRRDGRAMAERQLIRCMGGTDVLPSVDPAGLDVDARIDDLARAFERFAFVMDVGEWREEAAVAHGVAAWLAPSAERVARARNRAKAAGLALGPDRLPTREDLVAALAEARWLRGSRAVERSRSDRGKDELAGFLLPTPERLVTAIPPDRLCLPTLRDWCHVRRAVAIAAHKAAGRPVPRDIGPVSPGAARAAGRWLERLQQLRFARDAALRASTGTVADAGALEDVLARASVVREGMPAPRFEVAGIRAVDLRGEVIVLQLWASWCRPCIAQLPVLEGMAAAWAQQGLDVRVLAVSVDDDQGRYLKALDRFDWTWMQVVRDPALRRTFRAEKLPTLVVVDRAGVLRRLRAGYGAADVAGLDEAVRAWASMASDGRR